MNVFTFNDRLFWLSARLGKITGTRLKDIVVSTQPTKEMIMKVLDDAGISYDAKAKKEVLEDLLTPEMKVKAMMMLPKKIGFYELIAERLGVPAGENDEYPMERGSRLEKEAIARFCEETGKEVNTTLLLWAREDNESIALSPDGVVVSKKKTDLETEAIEVKCLSASKHIKGYLTQRVPEDYWMQALQYFCVNDRLQTLHFVMYDPRFAMFKPADDKTGKLDFFFIDIQRSEVEKEVKEYLEYQRSELREVDKIVNRLSF